MKYGPCPQCRGNWILKLASGRGVLCSLCEGDAVMYEGDQIVGPQHVLDKLDRLGEDIWRD